MARAYRVCLDKTTPPRKVEGVSKLSGFCDCLVDRLAHAVDNPMKLSSNARVLRDPAGEDEGGGVEEVKRRTIFPVVGRVLPFGQNVGDALEVDTPSLRRERGQDKFRVSIAMPRAPCPRSRPDRSVTLRAERCRTHFHCPSCHRAGGLAVAQAVGRHSLACM